MVVQAVRNRKRASGRRALPCGLLLLDLAWAVPAGAASPPASADQALAAEQDSLRNVIHPPCRPGGEEIVVCGRRSDRERVPFPDQRPPGARTSLLPGEPPSAVTAMREGDDPCGNVGPQPRCGGGISFITVGIVLLKAARHVADPDSDPPPTPIGAEATPPD